ncbi:glycosyltransferase family 2 protein [Thalassococcus sp. CAU 1522]|uniref:Glycosyltransferase family 2 protein n=1 Tax=Thalassococcus arenae TaxID=2851652 RepID=A0ABS6NA88_9RHOB|nr:glycosyltransferase family 2 protein [Thalassococcus arenae]MBV2360587.1 glycosyltransferase family 2 protein [Thalassococcus arenae]
MTTWGIVSTVKAPLEAIQRFAAWHLELGAHRLYLYLDDDVPDTLAALRAHPKIRAIHTDAAWWEKRDGRPEKHQVRQSLNARHANNRKPEVDWLAHIDVDEFLLPAAPVADLLGALPAEARCARIRPVEALAPGDGVAAAETAFKAFHLDQGARQAASESCFPTWGAHLSGGFLSHVAGKLIFRTGMKGLQIKIHNIALDGVSNPGQVDLPQIELGHFHAADWDHFLALYRFRMAQGSYRSELKSQVRRPDAVNLHDLFTMIESEGGEAALRLFYDEVCTASAGLCDRLDRHGLLRRHRMELDALRMRHFS